MAEIISQLQVLPEVTAAICDAVDIIIMDFCIQALGFSVKISSILSADSIQLDSKAVQLMFPG